MQWATRLSEMFQLICVSANLYLFQVTNFTNQQENAIQWSEHYVKIRLGVYLSWKRLKITTIYLHIFFYGERGQGEGGGRGVSWPFNMSPFHQLQGLQKIHAVSQSCKELQMFGRLILVLVIWWGRLTHPLESTVHGTNNPASANEEVYVRIETDYNP